MALTIVGILAICLRKSIKKTPTNQYVSIYCPVDVKDSTVTAVTRPHDKISRPAQFVL